jgi:hypothetical protein
MSRAKRVLGNIARDLPGVVLCKDMLVVAPTEHIVRGFLLETTTEKNRVYLWRVVTPLFRPISSVILNYSSRVSEPGKDIFIDPNAFAQSVEVIRNIIVENLEFVRGVKTPQDFLRHIEWQICNATILFRIDLALTYYFVGRIEEAIAIFDSLDIEANQLDAPRRKYVFPLIKQIVREIDNNPKGLGPLMEEWKNQNIKTLGLEPSLTDSSLLTPSSSSSSPRRSRG